MSNPRMMAIGDSLYQGVRTLSLTPEMVPYSVPAQVASALGFSFIVPDLPRPVVFDLEALIRKAGFLAILTNLKKMCIANVDAWLKSDEWSSHPDFDNIAIGGETIDGLSEHMSKDYIGQIPILLDDIKRQEFLDVGTLIDLWMALNISFTLNPQRRKGHDRETALDKVARRQPEILLVNIGSNDGLFDATFSGIIPKSDDSMFEDFNKKMEQLIRLLSELPKKIEKICVNSLVRPRCVPNLMPKRYGRFEDRSMAYNGRYYSQYIPQIGAYTTIKGSMMEQFDTDVSKLNANTFSLVKDILGDRGIFVNLEIMSNETDGKHYADRGIRVKRKLYKNTPIDGFKGALNTGGLVGLDNMHPTVLGYAAMAQAVVRSLGHELPKNAFEVAYAKDSLLQKLPFFTTGFQGALALLGSLGLFSGLSSRRDH